MGNITGANPLQKRFRNLKNKLRAMRVKNDPLHPSYHFTPPANWMGSLNGFIQWNGQTHLFFQCNPDEPIRSNIHWGHAVSNDLVNWKRLPLALSPTPEGPDRNGCFSGCCVIHKGLPHLVYTGGLPECQCLAYGSDDFQIWQKNNNNPMIPKPPSDMDIVSFHDP